MKKISKDSSAFVEIRRQKEEALQNIRREKSLMQIYSTALLSPLKHNNKGVPTTPMKSLFNTISNASYTVKLVRGVFKVFKLLH